MTPRHVRSYSGWLTLLFDGKVKYKTSLKNQLAFVSFKKPFPSIPFNQIIWSKLEQVVGWPKPGIKPTKTHRSFEKTLKVS